MNTSVEIRLNGKALLGPSPLKEKDNITVARTTINFSRLDLAPLPAPEPYEHPNIRERFTPGSKEKAISDVLLHLETTTPESGMPTPPLPGASAGPPKPPIPGVKKPPLPPTPPLPKKP